MPAGHKDSIKRERERARAFVRERGREIERERESERQREKGTHTHISSDELTLIGKQWVRKGGFPHLVAKAKIMDGGWCNFWR